VVTFNLDEYYPMPKESEHSYFRWMHETLFSHINVKWENIHIPDGTLKPEEVDAACAEYDEKIRALGGIDIQVLGIGRTGHIAFNEPGSPQNSRTRLVTLDSITRRDAADGFFGEKNVPHHALTMGVASILEARRVFLMAFGEHKAGIVYKAVEQPPTEAVSASFLQDHRDAVVVLDEARRGRADGDQAAVGGRAVPWSPELVRKAVVRSRSAVKKGPPEAERRRLPRPPPVRAAAREGPAERIGEAVFHDRMQTIAPYPAGGRTNRRAQDGALVFSPHPDDDVISMGGTIIRLVEQGHKVHIAYMTSGNVAVFDHDARRFVDFVTSSCSRSARRPSSPAPAPSRSGCTSSWTRRSRASGTAPDVLKVKSVIRATEARAGALACGVPPEQLEFMDLRFYHTGTRTKNPMHPQDLDDIVALLTRLDPAQVYVAGEMSDPHGTHRVCAEAVFAAVRRVRAAGLSPDVWLYKGAWEEWEPHEIEMAVPLSRRCWSGRSRRSSGTRARRTRRCSRAAPTGGSSGSGPSSGTSPPPAPTTRSGCPSTTRWRRSSAGATGDAPPSEPRP
jgi:glucosamine-6-phosphate deaminase